MVFLEEQTQTVGQLKFLNWIFGGLDARRDWLGHCARWKQRVKRPVCRGEIFAGDPLQVGRLHLLDGVEITFGKVEVVDGNPVGAQVLRLALHRFARGEDGRD